VIAQLCDCTFNQTRNQKPETRNQKPETRNQKPETRNQKPKLSMLEVVDFYKLKEKLNINKILLIVVS